MSDLNKPKVGDTMKQSIEGGYDRVFEIIEITKGLGFIPDG